MAIFKTRSVKFPLFDDVLQFHPVCHGGVVDVSAGSESSHLCKILAVGQLGGEDLESLLEPGDLVLPVLDLLLELCLPLADPRGDGASPSLVQTRRTLRQPGMVTIKS